MPNTTSRTLDLAGAGKGVITGHVSDGSTTNVLGLAKADSGSWTLAGTNTWTGNTSINAGTLIMNGSLGAGGTVTVATAAKLAGAGSIAANTNVNGTLQPGDGIGLISFGGSLNFGSASHLAWELGGNTDAGAGINFDKVNAAVVAITNNAVIDLSLNRVGSAVDFSDPFWNLSRTWPVLDATSITGSFKLGTVIADAAGRPATGYGAFSLQQTGTAINLVWTPRPPIEQWRFTHFTTYANAGNAADLADIDNDGIVNLLEYAFGGNPNVSSVVPLPRCGELGGKFSLTFTRTLSNTDITMIVQSSDSPEGPWIDLARSSNGGPFTVLAAGCEVSETGGEIIRTVEIRDSHPISDPAHPRGFLRVSVIR
jgi:autotransporter-associated beta strand protein